MSLRIKALRGFAIAITVLNILGHTVLGFEQSLLQLFVSLFTAYLCEILIELSDAVINKRTPAFYGSINKAISFLLPAHITGLAIGMLIYSGDNILPFAFASALAITSKTLINARINGKVRHFLNPSNTGIALTLLLFPWVSIAPPYHFTEHIYEYGDIVLPIIILILGSILNTKLTKRTPLIIAWFLGFAFQAIIRSLVTDISLVGALLPVTGLAFLLFTFYMITDPGTTPIKPFNQVMFGFSVALVYGVLMLFHVVFTLFFALLIVCVIRGTYHLVKGKINLNNKEGALCQQELQS
ncbi:MULTISPECIES: enediyne biosynthesis protein UnbU [Niallia]|uniref:enediyne biosynthesis protein UnbU n=1 Tax=Niallia TaxID=2837506 RepID=UPI00300B8E20